MRRRHSFLGGAYAGSIALIVKRLFATQPHSLASLLRQTRTTLTVIVS